MVNPGLMRDYRNVRLVGGCIYTGRQTKVAVDRRFVGMVEYTRRYPPILCVDAANAGAWDRAATWGMVRVETPRGRSFSSYVLTVSSFSTPVNYRFYNTSSWQTRAHPGKPSPIFL
jgi:hypothetical protein